MLCISWQRLGQGGVCFPSVRAGITKDFGPSSVLHRRTCQPGISGSGRVLLSTDLRVCVGLCCQGCLSPGSSGAEPGAGVGQAAAPVPAEGKATAFWSSGGWVK